MTESDVREQVRSRYARAAEGVTRATGRTALAVVDLVVLRRRWRGRRRVRVEPVLG